MTIPTDPIRCTNPPVHNGKPVKRTHQPTFLSGFCETGNHSVCLGQTTHPCGCSVPCRCTAEHPADRPHPYQETPVPDQLHPFQRPGEPDPVWKLGDGEHAWADLPECQPPLTPVPPASPPLDKPDEHGMVTLPPGSVEVTGDWHTHGRKPWRDGTGLDPIPLVDTVTAFAMSAGDLHRISDDPEDYDARSDALTILTVLRAGIRRAQELDALLVNHIYKHGQRGEQLIDGIGRVHVHRRDAKVKWDERGTAMAVIDRKMAELGGEQPDPYLVADWLLEAASIGYYRVTALRPLGIDPNEFRHSEKGTLAVDVPVPE